MNVGSATSSMDVVQEFGLSMSKKAMDLSSQVMSKLIDSMEQQTARMAMERSVDPQRGHNLDRYV